MTIRNLLLILAILVCISVAHAENPIFEAERLGQCGIWDVAIYQSGYAHEKWDDSCGLSSSYAKLHKVSADQIRRIKDILRRIKFDQLPDRIDPNTYVTDEDMYIFTVFSQKTKKSVKAYGLERAGNRDHAQRFETIWRTVIDVVPEPR